MRRHCARYQTDVAYRVVAMGDEFPGAATVYASWHYSCVGLPQLFVFPGRFAKDSQMRRVLFCVLFCVLLSFFTSEVASAGTVTARISGNSLFIYGDQGNNSIAIDSPQPGQIRVVGFTSGNGETTSVNGQVNGSVTLSGWTGGIFTYMYAGSDTVTLSNAVLSRLAGSLWLRK